MVRRFQRLRSPALSLAAGIAAACTAVAVRGDAPAHDYPTTARVEYVQECMSRNGGSLATLYQCSCVIDRMAEHLSFEEFVEASTFAHNATLGGEGGGIFRDSQHARDLAKLFRGLESDAYRRCGLKVSVEPAR